MCFPVHDSVYETEHAAELLGFLTRDSESVPSLSLLASQNDLELLLKFAMASSGVVGMLQSVLLSLEYRPG